MFSKLVRVLRRLFILSNDALYLTSITAKNGALHEIIGDDDLFCSFCSKQLESILDSDASVGDASSCYSVVPSGFHPISFAEYKAFTILDSMGFEFYNTDEVCDIEENFYSLDFSRSHPSLDSEDSFYISSKDKANLLRTHTTSSLIKTLSGVHGEFRRFTIGKVYRNDNSPKHLPFFTQVEGVVCERGTSLNSVVNLVKRVICEFTRLTTYSRIRRTYFPFTEPSLEIDLCCVSRFSSFKHDYNWLEVVGLGLIKQKVLMNFCSSARGVYAFGLGLERLTMLKLGVNNIKQLYSSPRRIPSWD